MRMDIDVRWPDYWPSQPSVEASAATAANHRNEVVEWWKTSNPVDSFEGKEAYATWPYDERHRLLAFADVMWVLAAVDPSLRAMVRRVTTSVYGAEFIAGVTELAKLAGEMTPRARSVALYDRQIGDHGIEDGDELDATLRMAVGEAVGRRLRVDPGLLGSRWIDAVVDQRVAEVIPQIQMGVNDVRAKLDRVKLASKGASGSGCLLPAGAITSLAWLIYR